MRPERGDEWTAAVLNGSIGVFLEIVTLFVELEFVGRTLLIVVRSAHAVLCAGIVLLLVVRRCRASARFSTAMFLATFLPWFLVFWLAQAERTQAGLLWGVFAGQQVGVMVLAALAPGPLPLGLALIGGLGIETVVQKLWLGEQIPSSEPWFSLAFSAASAGLHVNRVRRIAAEREAMRHRAEAEALARLTRTTRAINDLAYTPLQTLELSAALVRMRCPEIEPIVQRMDRALAQLKGMRELLENQQPPAEWRTGDESIDSGDVLAKHRK